MRRRLAALLVAAAAAGCGGGDDTEDGPAPGRPPRTPDTLFGEFRPIPLEQYLARGDRICANGRRTARAKLAPLQQKANADGELTPQEVMELNRAAVRLVRPMVRRLTQLPPPRTKRADAERYIRIVLGTVRALDEAAAAFDAEDVAGVREAIARNRKLALESADAAAALGFKQCGTEFSR
ncbi:MAG TPA: hypothetical protein VF587_11340 [Solirubrobacteraceae bacterium]